MSNTLSSKAEGSNVQLRRLNSTTSTNTTQSQKAPPPYTSTNSLPSNPALQTLRHYDSYSSNENPPSMYDTSQAQSAFTPTVTLHILSQGKKCLAFPSPSKELEIAILDEHKQEVKYLSIRPARRSGNCTLVKAADPSSAPLAATKYKWGPLDPPVVTVYLGEDTDQLVLKAKSVVSRTVEFESRTWGRFEWRYAGSKERQAFVSVSDSGNERKVPNNLLLLEKIVPAVAVGGESDKESKEQRVLVARLIRSEIERTPGTKGSTAGNGGRLEMCLSNMEIGKGDEKARPLVDEATVVATVLAMLKKEIDRRRAIQMMVICGMASG